MHLQQNIYGFTEREKNYGQDDRGKDRYHGLGLDRRANRSHRADQSEGNVFYVVYSKEFQVQSFRFQV